MSTTVAVPVRINARGGVATETRNVETIIALGVLPTGKNSPWDERDDLIVPSYVWESDGPETESAVRGLVRGVFTELERQGRARLLDVRRTGNASSGQARFVISWQDLETGTTASTVLPSSTVGTK